MKSILFTLSIFFTIQSLADLGSISDRKTGDTINFKCIDSECASFQIEMKESDGRQYTLTRPLTETYFFEALDHAMKQIDGTPWFIATRTATTMLIWDSNKPKKVIPILMAASPVITPLMAIEAVGDLLIAPGYEISKAVQVARIKKLKKAYLGKNLKVNNVRFRKILKFINERIG